MSSREPHQESSHHHQIFQMVCWLTSLCSNIEQMAPAPSSTIEPIPPSEPLRSAADPPPQLPGHPNSAHANPTLNHSFPDEHQQLQPGQGPLMFADACQAVFSSQLNAPPLQPLLSQPAISTTPTLVEPLPSQAGPDLPAAVPNALTTSQICLRESGLTQLRSPESGSAHFSQQQPAGLQQQSQNQSNLAGQNSHVLPLPSASSEDHCPSSQLQPLRMQQHAQMCTQAPFSNHLPSIEAPTQHDECGDGIHRAVHSQQQQQPPFTQQQHSQQSIQASSAEALSQQWVSMLQPDAQLFLTQLPSMMNVHLPEGTVMGIPVQIAGHSGPLRAPLNALPMSLPTQIAGQSDSFRARLDALPMSFPTQMAAQTGLSRAPADVLSMHAQGAPGQMLVTQNIPGYGCRIAANPSDPHQTSQSALPSQNWPQDLPALSQQAITGALSQGGMNAAATPFQAGAAKFPQPLCLGQGAQSSSKISAHLTANLPRLAATGSSLPFHQGQAAQPSPGAAPAESASAASLSPLHHGQATPPGSATLVHPDAPGSLPAPLTADLAQSPAAAGLQPYNGDHTLQQDSEKLAHMDVPGAAPGRSAVDVAHATRPEVLPGLRGPLALEDAPRAMPFTNSDSGLRPSDVQQPARWNLENGLHNLALMMPPQAAVDPATADASFSASLTADQVCISHRIVLCDYAGKQMPHICLFAYSSIGLSDIDMQSLSKIQL